ncbi:hypothetical protein [Treponema sp.]|uniref:hypothetical protein n=1 Tax=Treponema sp. TaxID=166 RepID=UPI00298E589C|nr:hypothetical protein [Treponema sp.]MCR5614474.1 hypothetical protein [Treponema sp.]
MEKNDDAENREKYISLEKMKMLVEKGRADINHKTKYGITASILALYYEEIEKAHYLIVQNKAKIADKFFLDENHVKDGISSSPAEFLRKLSYPSNSKEYQLKLEIIEEFIRQGVDYYNESVQQLARKERITKYSHNPMPEDIVYDLSDSDYDGDLYFFDLKIKDSIETVREKLTKQGYEFEEGYNNYLQLYKIWNKGMIPEERINMNFMFCFYKNKLYAFDKWSLSLEEAQKICNYHGGHFDVSLLKCTQYYKMQKSNWIICICNNGDLNILSIYDDVAASEVTGNYQTLE